MQDLRKYTQQKESLDNIRERILILRLRFESVKTVSTEKEPVTGGGRQMEDTMLDNIVERQRLQLTYKANKRMVALVEKGLACLTDNERLVLDAFFIEKRSNHIAFLCQKLGYEQAQVYRIKAEALYRFTMAMYGIMEY